MANPSANNSDIPVSTSWSSTHASVLRFEHSWKIGNPRFLFLKKNFFSLKSFPFEAGPSTCIGGHTKQSKWIIQIVKMESKDHCEFNLVYIPPAEEMGRPDPCCGACEIPVQFSLEIRDSAGIPFAGSTSTVELFSRSRRDLGFDRFVTANAFMRFITENSAISVVCELWLVNKRIFQSGKWELVRFEIPTTNTLAKDLEAMYYSRKELTDVTLVVGTQEFKAHKAILMARSPVFAAMFNSSMQENLRNRVEIEDIEAKVFEELLRFVYTDQVLDLGKHSKGLLMAAEKYELVRLKAMCEQVLYRNISVETAAETLMLADLHNAETLKKFVIGFVWANRENVAATTTWKALIEQKPQLAADLFNLQSRKRKAD